LQLENKDKLLENHISNAEKEKELLREKTILEHGKIVSKTKFLQEKSFNRLEEVNAKKKKITS